MDSAINSSLSSDSEDIKAAASLALGEWVASFSADDLSQAFILTMHYFPSRVADHGVPLLLHGQYPTISTHMT